MWSSLGFVPKGEGLGRGGDKETLDTWWLDLGHDDLFTDVQSDALLVVAVDHSVFSGLQGAGAEQAVEESRALEAGWLADLIELAYTPQLLLDVREIEDRKERTHQRAGLSRLRSASPEKASVSVRQQELVAAVSGRLTNVSIDAELRRRLRYVAETACAGLQVLASIRRAIAGPGLGHEGADAL